MKKVMLVFGTRPEAIKMCPLVRELKTREGITPLVCVTGQHRDMLDQVLDIFDIVPDYDLAIMKENQTLFDVTTNILNNIRPILEKERPDMVLVHGDTTTTYASALASFYLDIPVGHVEAGLRTYNMHSPFPEEFNRQGVGLIAKYHFAPTQKSKDNLIQEGKEEGNVYVTGNTGIDALKFTIKDEYDNAHLQWVGNDRLILITAHRRENIGQPMENMFKAIKRIVLENSDIKIIYPVHKNPKVREIAQNIFGDMEQLRIIEPLGVVDFQNMMNNSYLILTDSGGIQEEAPSLGKPVLVMRDTTERPEGIDAGTLKLVGTEEGSIYNAFKKLLEDDYLYDEMSHASNPYGDGLASKRIADILEQNL